MPGPFPTPNHVATEIRLALAHNWARRCDDVADSNIGPLNRETAPHDVRRFDIQLRDGRVYRVRVSDITPERETTP